jgi:hypothetical protein
VEALPLVRSREAWDEVLQGRWRKRIVGPLLEFVKAQRWFAGKGNVVRDGSVLDVIPLGEGSGRGQLVLLDVEYVEAGSETYLVALAYADGEAGRALARERPGAVAWRAMVGEEEGIVHEATASPVFCRRLLELVARGGEGEGDATAIVGVPYLEKGVLLGAGGGALDAVPGRDDQSNTSVLFGDRWILKLFRRVQRGPNPDLEVGRFLREVDFAGSPELVGALELREGGRFFAAAGTLHRFVPNRGNAWTFALGRTGPVLRGGAGLGGGSRGPTPSRRYPGTRPFATGGRGVAGSRSGAAGLLPRERPDAGPADRRAPRGPGLPVRRRRPSGRSPFPPCISVPSTSPSGISWVRHSKVLERRSRPTGRPGAGHGPHHSQQPLAS